MRRLLKCFNLFITLIFICASVVVFSGCSESETITPTLLHFKDEEISIEDVESTLKDEAYEEFNEFLEKDEELDFNSLIGE